MSIGRELEMKKPKKPDSAFSLPVGTSNQLREPLGAERAVHNLTERFVGSRNDDG